MSTSSSQPDRAYSVAKPNRLKYLAMFIFPLGLISCGSVPKGLAATSHTARVEAQVQKFESREDRIMDRYTETPPARFAEVSASRVSQTQTFDNVPYNDTARTDVKTPDNVGSYVIPPVGDGVVSAPNGSAQKITDTEPQNIAEVNQTESKSGFKLFKSSDGYAEPDEAMFVSRFPAVSEFDLVNQAIDDVFKVGDIADVTVYNVENLSATYVVDRAGNIVFPLIGKVKVAGTSTLELQETLTRLYGENYLRNPGISVKLEAAAVNLGNIVVDGAVEKPGVFELDKVIRLSEAIALGGGLDEDASRSQIYQVRNINGQRQVQIIDLGDIRKLGAEDPQVLPGDIIFVNESRTRVAFREFLRTVPIINTILIYGTRN